MGLEKRWALSPLGTGAQQCPHPHLEGSVGLSDFTHRRSAGRVVGVREPGRDRGVTPRWLHFLPSLPESDVFLIFSHGLQGCLEAQGAQVRVTPACNASLPAQRWKWVSRNRLFNLGTMQCLGTGWPGTNTTTSLGMYECDREALSLRWHCRTLGDQLSLFLGGRAGNASKPGTLERGDQTRSGQWRIYGSDEDLCARPYYGEGLLAGGTVGPWCQGDWRKRGTDSKTRRSLASVDPWQLHL